jgi:hypothetical protein
LAIAVFHLLRHGAGDSLLIGLDPPLAALRLAHRLYDSRATVTAVSLAALRLAILQNVLALRAIAVIAMLLEVLAIYPHLSSWSGRCSLGCEPSIDADVLELDACALLPDLAVSGYRAHSRQRISVPSLALGTSRDGASCHQLTTLETDRECVVGSVKPHKHTFATLRPDVALRVVVRPLDRVLV